jgi:hypothetical protein
MNSACGMNGISTVCTQDVQASLLICLDQMLCIFFIRRKADRKTAKYSLRHVVRSINTTEDALECVKV